MRQLPSPSKHERAAACPASEALPATRVVGEHWQSRGTVLHAYLADIPEVGVEAALERVPNEFRRDCEVIDVSALPACDPESYAAEVAIAYDVDACTARVLGQGLGRQYDIGPREIPGTLDVLGVGDDYVAVYDYKTGYAYLGPPEHIRQLRAYGLMAARAFGKRRAIVGTIRIKEDGDPVFQAAEFDEFALATVELELRELADSVEEARRQVAAGVVPETVQGDHCKHCPALFACPGKMALIRQFAAAPDALEDILAVATEEQLAQAWLRVHAVEKVLERVKGTLRDVASVNPIPMGDGTVIGPVLSEEVNADVAQMVLSAMYGPEVAGAAVRTEESVSKASIRDALRAHVLRRGVKLTHLEREVFEAIRQAGGMVAGAQVRRHRPKPKK